MPLEEPYGMRQTAALVIASADINTDKQISKVPYPSPAAGRAIIKKILIVNMHATDLTHVRIWDQDLDNANVPTNGSETAPKISIAAIGLGMASLTEDQLPGVVFESGFACQATKGDVYIYIEYAKDLG